MKDLFMLHHVDHPERFRLVEAAPGEVIPVEDDLRRMCMTRVEEFGMVRCACGDLQVHVSPTYA